MKKIVIIGAGSMGSAFTLPCVDNRNRKFDKRDYSKYEQKIAQGPRSSKSFKSLFKKGSGNRRKSSWRGKKRTRKLKNKYRSITSSYKPPELIAKSHSLKKPHNLLHREHFKNYVTKSKIYTTTIINVTIFLFIVISLVVIFKFSTK